MKKISHVPPHYTGDRIANKLLESDFHACVPAINVPEGVAEAIGFACDRAGEVRMLKNGKTALYWHLLAVVNMHLGEGLK